MSLGMTPQASHTNLRALDPLVHGVSHERLGLPINKEAVVHGGLGVITAGVFLAGEMAGSGVLALPYAMTGTGWLGLILILIFTINSGFTGTRLGLCWIMLEERYEEFRGQVRDPYPAIGEKAVGRWGRVLSVFSITLTLYGGGCVFIVLISQMLMSLMSGVGLQLSLCQWMVVTATCLTPLTWMGSPKDFWPIAVGALITTCVACILIVIKCILLGTEMETITYPPPSAEGFFKAFGSIMFAFAGASTFPTIQADMKERSKFPISATLAIGILFCIYFPMAAGCYFALGDVVQDNIVLSMPSGWEKITVEIMLLLHLITAYPIITNPPAQFFEEVFNIPSNFNWKRVALRTFSTFVLLFIAETVPSFGSILNLVGGSTVTLLTFVFPPYFYMRIADASLERKDWVQRTIPKWERVYCWLLIVIGFAGGCLATYQALVNIFLSSLSEPCYLMSDTSNITLAGGH